MPPMSTPPKSPLPATDWARARALYELAIDLPAGQREAFVRGADEIGRAHV